MDPKYARTIGKNDFRRLSRALEVNRYEGFFLRFLYFLQKLSSFNICFPIILSKKRNNTETIHDKYSSCIFSHFFFMCYSSFLHFSYLPLNTFIFILFFSFFHTFTIENIAMQSFFKSCLLIKTLCQYHYLSSPRQSNNFYVFRS